ncbi:hypothetical protein [Chitinophaga sp. GbtcB8]|uniref:hypothetical protein n=1 Tax=Chitinophaga sp. GbtcB8 TaxID=2824753 RepID=UPI001C309071|nr:hypothetical protein [Chitinophaga sp. GbtcB8]
MPIYLSCLLAWLLYSLFNTLSKNPGVLSGARSAVAIAFSAYIRTFFLVAAIAYTLLAVLVFMLNNITGVGENVVLARMLFAPLRALKQFHDAFHASWQWLSLALMPVLALIVIYYVIKKHAKRPGIINGQQRASGRAFTFFTSAGMHSAVNKTDTALSITSGVILLASLLILQAIQVPFATVNARYNLENIIVAHHIQTLDEKWNLHFPPGTQKKTPLSADLSAGIARLSRIMEREIMRSFLHDSVSLDSVQQFQLVSTQVRQNLLKAYVAQKQVAADPHAYEATNPFDNFEPVSPSPAATSFIKAYAYQTAQPGPATSFGKKMEARLSTAVSRLSARDQQMFRTQLRDLNNMYNDQVTIDDVITMSFENLHDSLADNWSKEILKNLLGEQVFLKFFTAAFPRSFQKAFDNILEMKARDLLTSIFIDHKTVMASIHNIRHTSSGGVISDHLTKIKDRLKKHPLPFEKMNNAIRQAPPAIIYNRMQEPEYQMTENRLDVYVEKAANNLVRPYIKAAYAGGLSTYEDYFPNSLQSSVPTHYAVIMKPLKRFSPTSIVAFTREEAFNNAFSFSNLSANPWTGGVLIGRSPEKSSTAAPDIRDMQWEDSAGFVHITLIDAAGKKYKLGSFSKPVIAQALAYAADARPVATTMINCTDGALPLRVLMHPALVNTPLGCNIISMDRFVDTYAYNEPSGQVQYALLQFRYQKFMYDACAYYLIFKRHLYEGTENFLVEGPYKQFTGFVISNFTLLKQKLLNGSVFNDPLLSPMRVKKSYYHQYLVDLIVTHLASSATGEEFFNKINAGFPGNMTAGDILITQSEIRSGVREDPYLLDPDLRSLMLPADDNPLNTLTFIEQVAYNKSRFCKKDLHPEVDNSPWAFPYIKSNNMIQRTIDQNVQDGVNKEIMDHALAFTVAQRLFRSAFSGALGLGFPLSRMGSLMEVCVSGVGYVKTPEWSAGYQSLPGMDKEVFDIMGVSGEENERACR